MALLESAQQAGTQVNGPYLMQGAVYLPLAPWCADRVVYVCVICHVTPLFRVIGSY